MNLLTTVVISVVLGGVWCKNFPPSFKFGVASASYQVEGAWNVSDKSPSIWDTFVHTEPDRVIDGTNGDIACDIYNQWRKYIEIADELGLDFYRFSLSWPRILPNGFSNKISVEGAKFYSDFIDGLLEKGIEPVITLYHFDLPQNLQDLGGWTNPLIADWFADYARVVYTLYADRVKTWLTINEPLMFCETPYNIGFIAPGILSPGIGSYLCNKHALLAHAKAWRIYDKEFRSKYNGKISLTNQIMWFEGADENEEEGAELVRQFMAGMYSQPIFSKEGGWPKDLENIIAEKSKKEGYSQSRLPKLTKDEIDLIKGTYDFFGINYYTARTVRRASGDQPGPWPLLGAPDIDMLFSVHPEWPKGATSWFYVYPEGLRKLMSWLKKEYGDMEFFIAENGFPTFDIGLDDQDRLNYHKDHLEQILLSIYEDEVNIVAYAAWTMTDNFEWNDGYRSKFGLYAVDFNSPARTRRPRASAKYYASVLKSRSLDVAHNLNNNKLTDELRENERAGDVFTAAHELLRYPGTHRSVAGLGGVYPQGLRKLMSWLKKEYGDMEFFIAENGFPTFDIGLDDQDRLNYHKDHLEQILLSIYEDEVNIVAYAAWTMTDNFEWNDGYRSKFGLYAVDFNSPARTRRPRASAKYYASVLKSRSLDVAHNLNNNKLTDEL